MVKYAKGPTRTRGTGYKESSFLNKEAIEAEREKIRIEDAKNFKLMVDIVMSTGKYPAGVVMTGADWKKASRREGGSMAPALADRLEETSQAPNFMMPEVSEAPVLN